MRFSVGCLVLFSLIACCVAAPSSSDFVTGANAKQEFALLNAWKSFKNQYSKFYESPEVEAHRYSIFAKNVAKANALTKKEGPHGAKFGVTKFMDLTTEEFRQQYLGYRPKKHMGRHQSHQQVMRPTEIADPQLTAVDWRKQGAVTPVKDQQQCGSCWAFSTTEEVESMWFMKHGKLPILSPQQIVSCDTVDQGCNGGDTVTAYNYVKSAGLETDAAYPYVSGDGSSQPCNYDANYVAANITGFTYATPACFDSCDKQDEKTLLNNLASHGPVSICVYAESWQTYTGGVLTDASTCPHDYSELDHCVQLVGYQSASPNNYWIVRNSWNTDWGQAGYIYVKFGGNLCGIADEATFATSA